MIFQDGLVNYLEVGERCKADDGYCGSTPLYAKCPGVIEANLEKAEIQQKVRNCQETVNKWFKNCQPLTATSCWSTRQVLV
jgi:hypothetical protein